MVTSKQEFVAAQEKASGILAEIQDPLVAAIAYELLLKLIQDNLMGHHESETQFPAVVDNLNVHEVNGSVAMDIDFFLAGGWSGANTALAAIQRSEYDLKVVEQTRPGNGLRRVTIDPTAPGEVVLSLSERHRNDGQPVLTVNHGIRLGATMEDTAAEKTIENVEHVKLASQEPGFWEVQLRHQILTIVGVIVNWDASSIKNDLPTGWESYEQYLMALRDQLVMIIQSKTVAELTDELHLLSKIDGALSIVNDQIELPSAEATDAERVDETSS